MSSGAMRWSLFAASIAVVAIAPFLAPHPFLFSILTQALIWVLVAASWDFLSGYTGQISFGHSGFFALGAYTAAGFALHFHVSPWLGLVGGMILPAIASVSVGLPALRLRGHYLALVTLGFAEIVRLVAQNWLAVTGGPFGMHDFGTFPGLPSDVVGQYEARYLVVLAVVAPSLAFMLVICEHTAIGKAFRAVREDEVLAESHGVNTKAYKLVAFMLSSALAGLAGGLFAFSVGLVDPNLSSAVTSSLIIGMAVFGGLGTIWGPAVGALVLFILSEGLRFVGVVYNLIAVGLVIMGFVVFLPRGLAGLRQGRGRRRLQGSRATANQSAGTRR